MTCQCGTNDFETTKVIGRFKRLGGSEIAFFHNAVSCGWAFECQDCWGTCGHDQRGGFRTGFQTEDEAVAALFAHIESSCIPNKRPEMFV